MTPHAASSPHTLAAASGLLVGTFAIAIALGALIGWVAGAWEIGLLLGAVAGIPVGIVAVYLVYGRAQGGVTARQASPQRVPDDEDSW